jgi:hypothetical protein
VTLRELADRLAAIDLDAVAQAALAAQAEAIATATRDALDDPPSTRHEYPALRTGTLHDSIVTEADAAGAVVASIDPVALYQELGTVTLPPRPFLAPVAAACSETAADAIGAAIAGAIVTAAGSI